MADNIVFSFDPAAHLKTFLEQRAYSNVAVLTDENTERFCYPIIEKSLPAHHKITVASGEEFKTLSTCEIIWQALTERQFDRHSVLIILGGGVLGDMGGFCAATYKRGIDFVLVSTSLLSQVDSSIGGKLGIDFHHLKNHIGVFQHPAMTLLSEVFLKTLPAQELRSGFAEIIKHILISDKKRWLEIKSRSLSEQNWQDLIQHSVAFKLDVVTQDPKEKGLRKVLNTGHTIGHALETHLLNTGRKILHGEAIAVGLVAEASIAKDRRMISDHELVEISRFIKSSYGTIGLSNADLENIATLAMQDKKNRGNKIMCVLLDGIGNAKWDCEISAEEVKGALTFYLSS